MKIRFTLIKATRRCAGFSLVELLIGLGLVAIVGGMVYSVYSAGQVLFGKNSATNVATESSRVAYNYVSRDIHLNVGPTQLLDVNTTNGTLPFTAGNGPAGGIALRSYAGGPSVVASDALATDTVIRISPPQGLTPVAGDLLSLPAFRIELYIKAVVAEGPNWKITFWKPVGQPFPNTSTTNYVAFVTRWMGYAAVGSELRRYSNLGAPLSLPSRFALPATCTAPNCTVVARGITSAQPFSFPAPGGIADTRYINVVLSNTDPSYTQRKWEAVDSLVNFTAAFRVPTPLTTR